MLPITATGLLALAASAAAVSQQLAKNFCLETVYLTINASGSTTGPFELPSGQAYIANITGTGNSLGVSKNEDYYSPETPKLVLGTSTADDVLYWTLSSVNGNPFQGETFNLTSSGTSDNVCGNATTYDGQVHACRDTNQLLTLNMC